MYMHIDRVTAHCGIITMQNADLALLSINTFQKDLTSSNPRIRANALKGMSSIRLPVVIPLVIASAAVLLFAVSLTCFTNTVWYDHSLLPSSDVMAHDTGDDCPANHREGQFVVCPQGRSRCSHQGNVSSCDRACTHVD